jgi:nicotinamide mononucleotide transporter
LYKASYFGDMMMNFYYSVMSIYGWWNWSRKKDDAYVVPISRTNTKEKLIGVVLVILTMMVTYGVYRFFDYTIETVNYIDIFTSGIFFTAMWYMATKKIENWTLWIFADVITVPLYAYRGLGMLSLQYLIFTILAIQGYLAWRKSLDKNL